MKYLLLLILVFSKARASDFGEFYVAANDAREVIAHDTKLLPVNSPMKITTEQSDLMQSMAKLDAEVQHFVLEPNCTEEDREKILLSERTRNQDFAIVFSGTYSGDLAKNKILTVKDLNRFERTIADFNVPAADKISNFQKLRSAYLEKTNDTAFSSKSLSEQGKLLTEYAKSETGIDLPKNILLAELAFHATIENPDNWEKNLKEVASSLNFQDKKVLLNEFGNTFNDNYNFERLKDHKGIVDLDKLLNSAKTITPGGICTDIALGQAKMAQALGIPEKNLKLVAYASPSGGHAALAMINPDDKAEVATLNYGQQTLTNRNKAGAAAVAQVGILPDTGINYRYYNADGTPAGQISSEMGTILREVTNAKSDPLKVTGLNLARAEVVTPFGNGSFFTGNTSGGDSIVGVAIDHRDLGKTISTSYGGAAFKRTSKGDVYQLDEMGMYMVVGMELRSPNLIPSDSVLVHARGGLESEFALMKNTTTKNTNGAKKSATNMDTRMDLYTALDVDLFSKDNSTRVFASVEPHGYVSLKNINDQSKSQTIVYDHTRVVTGVKGNLTEDIKAQATVGVVLREVGNSYTFTTGLEMPKEKFRINASMQGPINDVPRIYNGSTRIASLSAEKDTKKASFRLIYEKDFDTGATSGKAGVRIPLNRK